MRHLLPFAFATICGALTFAERLPAFEIQPTTGAVTPIPTTVPAESQRVEFAVGGDLNPAAPPEVYLPPAYPPIGAASVPSATESWTDPSVVAAGASVPGFPPIDGGDDATRFASLETKVNNLLQSTTGTTYPTVKVNGVFQTDAGWVNQDQASIDRYGNILDGVDFRRARLAASGALTDVNNYFMQMDFAFFGRPTFTDLWVEQTDLPILGNVRVGQWKQPFSLEVVSSFRFTTFVERSVLFQPFTPFRHIGIGFYNRNKALTSTWAGSAFAAGNDQYGGSVSTAGGIGTAERITWLPKYDEPSGGRYYLHLGAAHFFSAPNDHLVNFRTIPELFIGAQPALAGTLSNQQPVPGNVRGMPFFVATGNILAYNYNIFGSELLWVRGPFSLQAEGMGNVVNLVDGTNQFFYGGYAQVGYFLTGEHRPYDRKAGAIDRVKPFENVFGVRTKNGGVCRGWGAWEIAGRASTLNLNGDYVPLPDLPGVLTGGGIITDLTLGVNWYLNAYTKAQFNYIHSHTTNAPGAVALSNLFDLRLQMDF